MTLLQNALRLTALLGILQLVVGCGALQSPPRHVEAGPTDTLDGADQLERAVVPQRYTLDLDVDPRGATLSGQIRIALKIAQRTQTLRLHADDLTISSAALHVGGHTWPAEPTSGAHGALQLRFAERVPAGDAELVIRYQRAILRAPHGVYRLRLGDDWYAFTQFEATHAREAFPCFDEPGFKAPFKVTIRVPEGQLAVANGPEAGRKTTDGRTTFEFAETRPLPTYLVAFAVGPFDVVESEAEGEVPLRLIAARGRGRLAAFALERAGELLNWMTEWFDRPYPFAKLDLLAVPGLAAGAMENAGLVTFRETLLLLDETTAPPQRRSWAQLVLAHELTHAWVGNMVTPADWDQVWLSEAFATFMSTRAVSAVEPELDAELEEIARTHWVMSIDSQRGAQPIRRPDAGPEGAFDRLAYVKGAALLRMVEAWIGAEAFQKGVRAWLDRYAHATANADSLLAALSAQAKRPVESIFAAFLDRPGVPMVETTLACDDPAGPTLTLRQRPTAPPGKAPAVVPWVIPVCVHLGHGAKAERRCHLLDTAEARVPLKGACPDWIHPNADQTGYYRWSLPVDRLLGLVRDHRSALTARERVGLVGQLEAQLEVGAVPLDVYLTALTAVSETTHPVVVGQLINALARLHATAVDPDERDLFAAFARRLLDPHRERLGELSVEEEPAETARLRPRLLDALAYLGRDAGLRNRARAVVDQFTVAPENVELTDLVRLLPIAAWDGDAALWSKLRATLDHDPEPVTRAAVVTALGAFEAPALLTRSLDLLVDGTLTAADHRSLTRAISHPNSRRAAWTWLTTRYGALVERLGPEGARGLVWLGAGFCSMADHAEVQRFFSNPRHAQPGADRDLALVLQGIEDCARLRTAIDAPLHAWLNRR